MAKKRMKIEKQKNLSKDNQRLYAFLASFFTIIGFILAIILWKKDKYIMFYAKQGLILFLVQIIIVILTPLMYFLTPLLWIFFIILWAITWINALSGKIKRTFIIGEIADKIKI